MTNAAVKLEQDLSVLETMATNMADYLMSDVLFWNMGQLNMPNLTLGGYLMRQHRLLALRDELLGDGQRNRLQVVVQQFNRALEERIVRFEQKAHNEIGARIRQWEAYLNDLNWDFGANQSRYATAVEARAMLDVLIEVLRTPPYQLNERIPERVAGLDDILRGMWKPGAFVWADGLQPAYPQEDYWWLYGRPSKSGR